MPSPSPCPPRSSSTLPSPSLPHGHAPVPVGPPLATWKAAGHILMYDTDSATIPNVRQFSQLPTSSVNPTCPSREACPRPHPRACPPAVHFRPPTAYLSALRRLHMASPRNLVQPRAASTTSGHPQAPYACTWPLPMSPHSSHMPYQCPTDAYDPSLNVNLAHHPQSLLYTCLMMSYVPQTRCSKLQRCLLLLQADSDVRSSSSHQIHDIPIVIMEQNPKGPHLSLPAPMNDSNLAYPRPWPN